MSPYEVTWTVVVHADSAEEAEQYARTYVQDPHFEPVSVTELGEDYADREDD